MIDEPIAYEGSRPRARMWSPTVAFSYRPTAKPITIVIHHPRNAAHSNRGRTRVTR